MRLRLIRSVFGTDARLPDAGDSNPPYNATAVALRYPDRELWIATTSGTRVYDGATGRAQVAALYEPRGGEWTEVARQPLASTPVATAMHQLAGPVLRDTVAWIAVTGATAAKGGTYEMLRFDGKALTSSFWWYSPRPQAGTEADLDGDGVPEVILDASDPGVLCATCGVLDISEVVYRWVNRELVPVQLAPLPGLAATTPGTTSVAGSVARAIALANAGLWTDAAAAMSTARAAAPSSEDVRWMAIVIDHVAAARAKQAGSSAQPLLTEVLAGDYAAATARMRHLEPAEAFATDGPLVTRTAADGRAAALGAALVQASARAIGARPELVDAYLVRALGEYLRDPKDLAPALADASRAAASGDAFARSAVILLNGRNATPR